LERFEYVCRECDKKGSVRDVLLNAEVLLIRGYCSFCKKQGTYKVVDIEALRKEHEAIAREESASHVAVDGDKVTRRRRSPRTMADVERAENSVATAKNSAEVAWKWELIQDQGDHKKDKGNTDS
jgi:hypothetical protein